MQFSIRMSVLNVPEYVCISTPITYCNICGGSIEAPSLHTSLQWNIQLIRTYTGTHVLYTIILLLNPCNFITKQLPKINVHSTQKLLGCLHTCLHNTITTYFSLHEVLENYKPSSLKIVTQSISDMIDLCH